MLLTQSSREFLKRYLGVPPHANNAITHFLTSTQLLMYTLNRILPSAMCRMSFPGFMHGHKLLMFEHLKEQDPYDPTFPNSTCTVYTHFVRVYMQYMFR